MFFSADGTFARNPRDELVSSSTFVDERRSVWRLTSLGGSGCSLGRNIVVPTPHSLGCSRGLAAEERTPPLWLRRHTAALLHFFPRAWSTHIKPESERELFQRPAATTTLIICDTGETLFALLLLVANGY